MALQLVESGAHKCSKKSESNVDEEKTTSEVRKLILASVSVFWHL
jgi:hypothetical protein